MDLEEQPVEVDQLPPADADALPDHPAADPATIEPDEGDKGSP